MKMYDVPGYDTPLLLSEEHAELIGATEHTEVTQPRANASTEEWRSWAVSERGIDPTALEGLSRTQIIETYGSTEV